MAKELDVALATCVELPEPDPDREPLLDALRAAGVRAAWFGWDDPAVDWSMATMTILRSTWNYPQAFDAFRDWLERVAAVSRLENPLELVRENLHKGYLDELARQGIPVTPTELVRRGDPTDLATVMHERAWDDVVVKPAVSAPSWRTVRAVTGSLDEGERHLRALVDHGDALVQGYLPSVEGYGERAIMVIDGVATHSVRKSPRFSGQDEWISETRMPISPEEQTVVDRVMARWPEPPLYVRVDLAPGPTGAPVVMELELSEPSLFFDQCPEALERFVAGVVARLERG
jgi:nucleotide-binding universal stress UspA family protein